MKIQPKTDPTHHTAGESLNARMKFSVPIEKNSDRHIAFMRFFGAGADEAIKLPTNVAAPMQKFKVPKTVSPPFGFGSIIGRTAAPLADAIRFIPAKKNISLSMTGFALSHESPAFAVSAVRPAADDCLI